MRKKNNNLVLLDYKNGEKKYFTSKNLAGLAVGLAAASIDWAIKHKNIMTDNADRELRAEIVDGSEVPYKMINN